MVSILANVCSPVKKQSSESCWCSVILFETCTVAHVWAHVADSPAVGGSQIAQCCLQPVLLKSLRLVYEVI